MCIFLILILLGSCFYTLPAAQNDNELFSWLIRTLRTLPLIRLIYILSTMSFHFGNFVLKPPTQLNKFSRDSNFASLIKEKLLLKYILLVYSSQNNNYYFLNDILKVRATF